MTHPLAYAYMFEYWLMFALGLVALALEVWAFADALRRRPEDFLRAGIREKRFWLMLTGAALAVGLLSLLGPSGGFGMFGIIALCIAAVYLAGPREQMNLYSGGRSAW
jgi:Flp pilus assembly protein TadB